MLSQTKTDENVNISIWNSDVCSYFQNQNDKYEFTSFNKSTWGSRLYRRQDIKHENTLTYFLYFTRYYGILWWIYTLFSAKLNWIVTWFVVCRCIAIWNIGNILEVLVINCNTSLCSMFERRKYEKNLKIWKFVLRNNK